MLQLLECFTVDPPSTVPPGVEYGVSYCRGMQYMLMYQLFWFHQPFIEIFIPEDHWKFLYFVHNKGQMYFPKQDEAFGSFYFDKSYNPPKNQNYTFRYIQSFRLVRTHWKTLPTENQRCDERWNSGTDTTNCITNYLEQTVGCSMGLLGTNPKLKRYHFKSMCCPKY